MKEALRYAQIDFCQIPTNILIGKPSSEILAISKKNNINIVAYNVLASGLLTGKPLKKVLFQKMTEDPEWMTLRRKIFNEFKKIKKNKIKSKRFKISLSKYCIQWVLNQKK